MAREYHSIDVRAYQLVCLICRLGDRKRARYPHVRRLDEILSAVRLNPQTPLTLCCNVDSIYAYQNPGRRWDTPGGGLFNCKRDLDIIQMLGLTPGDTRPARELLRRVFAQIPSCKGICGYGKATSATWKGCTLASSGNYERGHAMGMEALIPPRDRQEKAKAKQASCKDMDLAGALEIRPHHLMCMACFSAGRQKLHPIEEDNLFEAIEIVRRKPDIPVRLVTGPCMICPPCSDYDPRTDLCVKGIGGGLRDQKKDLDVLQLLGLKFGDVLPAGKLFRLLFRRVQSTRQVCGYNDGITRGQEWTICMSPEGNPGYKQSRKVGLWIPGVRPADHP